MHIIFDKNSKTFFLENKEISYVFKIEESGFLRHLYWGKRISRDSLNHLDYFTESQSVFLGDMDRMHPIEEYPLELGSFGNRGDYRESSISINNLGHRTLDLRYKSHKILSEKPEIDGMPSLRDGKTLKITMFDNVNKIKVDVFYTIYDDSNAIARRMEIVNLNDHEIKIEKAFSACVDIIPKENMQAITFHGAWLRERMQEKNDITHAGIEISSTRGVSSAQTNPSMIIAGANTTMYQGTAIGINLIYSGDFAIKAKQDQYGRIRLTAGINDEDFDWTLKKNEKFSTPEAVFVYSCNGINAMSQSFHNLYRNHLINSDWVKKSRPIICNNWEATGVDFNEKKLMRFIDSLKGSGVDTFVLDDGWFLGRNSDSSSLGDWIVDKKKLPRGLEFIIEYTHKAGLKFGLWFEPEMISKNSLLYQHHPDWAIKSNTIASEGRNQYVLDLSKNEVCDFVIDTINKYLDTYKINYIKWDMNRYLTESFSSELGTRSKEHHHRYNLGLYKVLDAVIKTHPDVFFEGCASGGARFDAGMLAFFPQIWASDNSDAYSRSIIQTHTSLFYPLSSIDCHVTTGTPNMQTGRMSDLTARFSVASMGSFGCEMDFSKLSDEDKRNIREFIAFYKKYFQTLVLSGDTYILSQMNDNNLWAQQIVSKDKALSAISILQGLNKPIPEEKRIYPQGLVASACYRIMVGKQEKLLAKLRGDTIMNAGINVNNWPLRSDPNGIGLNFGDFVGQTLILEQEENETIEKD